ncbi:serine endoprotease DegQ [Campylobacterota bacterium]|nr:serine endoprotease DegQ [Campylobacterota bacterium]
MRKFITALLIVSSSFAAASANFQEFKPTTNDPAPISYAPMLKSVRLSVVNVSIQKSVQTRQSMSPFLNDPFFRQFFDDRAFNIPKERIERSLGSGVIISRDGYIVTNNHVVEGAEKVIVTLASGKDEYEAKVIGSDPKSDLAVIKIEAKNLTPALLYNSDNVQVGDLVFAIGNPFGVGETITSGIVSATNRTAVGIVEYEDFIQTDAAINPGNSGGALVNSLGALVGVNSAILTRSGASHGVGFSIPSNMVKQIATQLIENGEVKRAWLGVSISDMQEDLQAFYSRNAGAMVTGVEPSSPAEKAGVKRGDLIVKIESKTIESASQLKNTIGAITPNTKVAIELIRDKKVLTLNATLVSLDKQRTADDKITSEYKGLTVAAITDETRSRLRLAPDTSGVIIEKIAENSEAAKAGLLAGDVIVQIENSEINNIDSFKKAVNTNSKKRLFIKRRGVTLVAVL